MSHARERLLHAISTIRTQDVVWVLLFGVLIARLATTEVGDIYGIMPLVGLGVAQILEGKIPALAGTPGRIFWIVLKLVFGYLLIGFTGSIDSPYWLVLLLPVVSAATTFNAAGTLLFSLFTGVTYLTYLFFVHEWSEVTADLPLRIVFLAMVGNLANMLAEDLRIQSEKHRLAAEELARANIQIQQAEEAMRRSDRLAALGQLSAGLAHELRNPLGTIKGSSDMLKQTLSTENEVAREVAGFISSEVDRCNALITRFLQFARPLQLSAQTADLAQTLDRAIELASREAPGITVYKNYQLDLAPFVFDAELMERVFYNLVLNAAQASPEGGAVTVKMRAAGKYVEISVIDRGSGISSEDLNHIFNPFFTTKPAGVGLGLAIVSKVVDEHGGKITVSSEPGKGSIFHVLLPRDRSGVPSEPA